MSHGLKIIYYSFSSGSYETRWIHLFNESVSLSKTLPCHLDSLMEMLNILWTLTFWWTPDVLLRKHVSLHVPAVQPVLHKEPSFYPLSPVLFCCLPWLLSTALLCSPGGSGVGLLQRNRRYQAYQCTVSITPVHFLLNTALKLVHPWWWQHVMRQRRKVNI